jgi:diguanylate cyclase (GGDEF)-like protein
MQLARFQAFVQEVSSESRLRGLVRAITIYRWSEGHWIGTDGGEAADAELRRHLDHTREVQSHWRARNSRRAYFPIRELECVVMVDFSSPPKRNKQDSVATSLAVCLQHSADAFSASHDPLTGLYNRGSFETKLKESLETHLASADHSSRSVDSLTPPSAVSLLALDLDNFKQVNDTFGHLYGDVVLRCFAQRLQHRLNLIEQRLAGRSTLVAGRIGGEEFLVLIAGSLSVTEVDQITDEIRESVANTPLPDDSEWGPSLGAETSSLQLPHVSERRITVSAGVASVASLKQPQGVDQSAAQLRAQADTALLRAKIGGRNVARRFGDILARYGTILEHHPQADVVAIDIGRQVGVAVGQEFVVYHPDFGGDKAFIYSDGRTRKRLGGYPRYPCGRIVVFDVQQDVSFCTVVDKKIDGQFPGGSTLEVVPLGAIAHLVESGQFPGQFGVLNMTPIDTLNQVVHQSIKANEKISVVVCTIKNISGLAEARGSFFVNRALANLYESLRETLPGTNPISQVQSTQFALAVRGLEWQDVQRLIEQALDLASTRSAGLASFRAGAFSASKDTPKLNFDSSSLNPDHSLDYARYAVSTPEDTGSTVEWFSTAVPPVIVGQWRARQLYRDGLTDYRKFRELGIRNAYLENQASLCALAVGHSERETALDAIKRATELAPTDPVLVANHGYIEFHYGDRVAAHRIFATLPSTFSLANVYRPMVALAAYAQYQVDPASVNAEQVKARLADAIEIAPEHWKAEIRGALATFADQSP